MWLLDRLQPGTAIYNLGYVLRLSGPLDSAALDAALTALVAHHAPLRTRIVAEDGASEPMQIVAAPASLGLVVEWLADKADAAHIPIAARAAAVEEARLPFDLATGPLLRARLLQLHEKEHWLLLTMHHAVFDGWSASLLWRQLAAVYSACRRRRRPPLPPQPIQYADYAARQREQSKDAEMARQIAYWRDALHELPVLALPSDRPRPAQPSGRGNCLHFAFDPALVRALRDLAHGEGTTLFTVLLAAFQVLLHRYSGQHDIAVGLAVAGRTRSELRNLVGFFVNTLVLRGNLSGEPSFRTYLGQVHAQARAAYAHQDVPFERLVEELAPQREPGRNPFFDVLVNLQRLPSSWSGIRMGELEVAAEKQDTGTAKFDLNLRVGEDPESVQVQLEYAIDLFEPSTIDRMLLHWRVLIEAIVADPKRSIGKLPLFDATERRAVLQRSRGPAHEAAPRTLVELFTATAARVPCAAAAVCGGGTLSYAVLDARANRLAHLLRLSGVGPETPVVVALDRSLDLAIAVLGVLKAGGAYVPLDPRHPGRRLAQSVDGSAPPVIARGSTIAGRAASPAITVDLDRDQARLDALPATPPPPHAAPTRLACILHTSGSTGEPKGVMIEHRSVVAHLAAMGDVLGGGPDHVLQSAPIGFDQSLWQMFWAWQSGGSVVFPEDGADSSPESLVAEIRRHRITLLRTVPSLLGALAYGPGLDACPSLRTIVSAGEVLPPTLAEALRAQSTATLYNAYGPTETTFVTTIERYAADDRERAILPGTPLAGTSMYVTDAAGEVVPDNVVGEIRIGGAGLARGYWQHPELTEAAFVDGSAVGESRVYRTGDHGRRLPDGRIEFLGRHDLQVKIRGVRVELGEIEAATLAHPAVAACAVLYERDPCGREHVNACIQPRRGASVTREELQVHLRERLPRACLPTAYTLYEALPLTAHGKIDRRRLAAAAKVAPAGVADATSNDVPRGNDALARVAALWMKILGSGTPQDDDDFFAMGGHSLAAMQLLSRVRGEFGVKLSLRDFFARPTLSGIAAALVANGVADDTSFVVQAAPATKAFTQGPQSAAGARAAPAQPLGKAYP